MFTFAITWQRYKGHQGKNMYIYKTKYGKMAMMNMELHSYLPG